MKNYFVETEGVVTESLANSTFKVHCDNNTQVLCETSRSIRKNYIPIAVGDRVKVSSKTYGSARGIVIDRLLYRPS